MADGIQPDGTRVTRIGRKRSAFAALSFAATAFLAVAASGAVAVDWPSWRGPTRNGIAAGELNVQSWPAAGPSRLWSAQIGKSYAGVAVQGGRVYAIGTAAGKETVYCFDARSGAVRWQSSCEHAKRDWQYDPNPTASTGSPVVAANRVYLLTRDGIARCLNSADGKPLWERDLAKETQNGVPMFGCGASPVVEGGLAVFNVGKNGVALDAVTGAVVWNSGPGAAGDATPVVLPDGRTVAFFTGSGLAGVELKTGKRLWLQAWTTPGGINAIDPVIAGDRIFLTGYLRGLQLRLQGDTISEGYETRSLRSSFVNPVLIGNYLFGTDRGTLSCLDWSTGAVKWSHPGLPLPVGKTQNMAGPPPAEGGLIATGKQLLLLDGTGTLHVIAAVPDGFHEAAQAHLIEGPCWTMPALADGMLFVHNTQGELVAFGVK